MLLTFNSASLPPDFAVAWALERWSGGRPSVNFLPDPLAVLPVQPPSHDIAIWVGTLVSTAELPAFARLAGFTEFERTQLSALRRRVDAVAYAAAHGGLRLILGNMLKCPPGALQFGRGRHGKPFLWSPFGAARELIQFSISHSAGLAAVGLSRQAIGIDIERAIWSEDLLDVARSNFAEEQLSNLVNASDERRKELFFRYWTLGEAFIKATGLGISQGLNSFAFTADGQPRLTRVTPGWGTTERWSFGLYWASLRA
jgi:4'-phosphopantetheinyl transferase